MYHGQFFLKDAKKIRKIDNKTKMVLTEMNVEKQKELGSPCDLEVHINLTSLHLQKFTTFHGFTISNCLC